MLALKTVARIVDRFELSDCWIAAGFVRNLVWDKLHSNQPNELNDIDVIYFNRITNEDNDTLIENALYELQPGFPWSVKNQAKMHVKNGDKPYGSSADAMSFWPEKETAVAVKYTNQQIEVCAPFGINSLFALHLTHNPKRSIELFNQRVTSKHWRFMYPKLQIHS